MDIALALTGAAALAGISRAAWCGRDLTLPGAVLTMWGASFALLAADATMATFVTSAVMMNMLVSGIALVIVTRDQSRHDARLVGGLSMAVMPAHWVVSVSNGAVDWTIYAWSCNVAYVLQCLVSGGWFDGVGRSISRIFGRFIRVSLFRAGER